MNLPSPIKVLVYGLVLVVVLLFAAGFALQLLLRALPPPSARAARTASTTSTGPANAEPDEPCRVDAPPEERTAAQNWCQGGMFKLVHVKTDNTNFVVLLQFSKKGMRAWTVNGPHAFLNRFRHITDEMVEKTDMNVAFSLLDPKGQMLGGCARQRRDCESTCNAR